MLETSFNVVYQASFLNAHYNTGYLLITGVTSAVSAGDAAGSIESQSCQCYFNYDISVTFTVGFLIIFVLHFGNDILLTHELHLQCYCRSQNTKEYIL